MEKKQKIIKAIICILTALLIAGCFIAMAFMPKIFETKSASADVVENPPTENITNVKDIISYTGKIWQNPTQEILYFATNGEISYIDFDIAKYTRYGETRSKQINIKIKYSGYRETYNHFELALLNKNGDIQQRYIQMKTGVYQTFDSTTISNWNDIGATRYIRIYLNGLRQSTKPYVWLQIWKMELKVINNEYGEKPYVDGFTYTSYIYDILNSNQIPAYENGYNVGYQVGYDKGIVSEWQSPIAIFIQPIDSFLSTDIFGSISIGDVLSVILFVMVGIIFIKMFAGG